MCSLVIYNHGTKNIIQTRPLFWTWIVKHVPRLLRSYWVLVPFPLFLLIFRCTSPAHIILYCTPPLQQCCWWGTSPVLWSLKNEYTSSACCICCCIVSGNFAERCQQMVLFPFHALLLQMVWCICLRLWSLIASSLGCGLAKLRGVRSWSMLQRGMRIMLFCANLHLLLSSPPCRFQCLFCHRKWKPPPHLCRKKRSPLHRHLRRSQSWHLHRLVDCLV